MRSESEDWSDGKMQEWSIGVVEYWRGGINRKEPL